MSIIFVPKIASSFEGSRKTVKKVLVNTQPRKPRRSWLAIELNKPKGKRSREWSPQELNILVDLRALNTSIYDCCRLLKRGECATSAAIVHYKLYDAIKSKKLLLVSEVMNVS
jgi:hypothetical protein|tara:strand:+ start:502 stop:840 length:339 start_codon:yes stop_codon:yes gene_type:complete